MWEIRDEIEIGLIHLYIRVTLRQDLLVFTSRVTNQDLFNSFMHDIVKWPNIL